MVPRHGSPRHGAAPPSGRPVPPIAAAIAAQPEMVLEGAQLSGRFPVTVVPEMPAVAPRVAWLKIPPPSVPAELPVIELLPAGCPPGPYGRPGPYGPPVQPWARPGPGVAPLAGGQDSGGDSGETGEAGCSTCAW